MAGYIQVAKQCQDKFSRVLIFAVWAGSIQVANIVKIFTPRNKYVYGSPLLVNRMYTLKFKQQHLFPSDGDVISSAVTVLRVYALCGPHYRDIART